MKIFFSLLLLFMPILAFAKTYLFVLFDAGETYALQPVIEMLIEKGEQVEVLTFGTAQALLPNGKIFSEVDRSWDRYRPLSEEKLQKILEKYHPEVVMVGVASKIQLQIAQAYEETARIVAYYDNFNPIERNVYASLIRLIEPHTDLFLTASEFGAQSSYAQNVHVVGNPDIDKMVAQISKLDVSSFGRPVVAYIGGYDADYEEALALFKQSMHFYPSYHLVICPHPKSNGVLEKKYFPKANFSDNSLVAIAAADIVICHRSTLGIKSFIAGKKVIFVDPIWNPMPGEWGAFLATDINSFRDAMDSDPMEIKCQVPKQSTALFWLFFADEKSK